MCLESYLAANLLADLALIGAVSRALGLFNWKRALISGLLCAIYALPAAARPKPWSSLPMQCAVLAAISWILTGRSASRQRLAVAMLLGAGALIGSGMAIAFELSGIAAGICGTLVSGLMICALFGACPPGSRRYQISVRLEMDRRSIRFPALVDTGNRLLEPVSGLPVLIAEANLLRGFVPQSGCRELRYGAVGSEGVLSCFKPTSVWISNGVRLKRAPDIWVGVVHTPLPGVFRALAPAVYALYI